MLFYPSVEGVIGAEEPKLVAILLFRPSLHCKHPLGALEAGAGFSLNPHPRTPLNYSECVVSLLSTTDQIRQKVWNKRRSHQKHPPFQNLTSTVLCYEYYLDMNYNPVFAVTHTFIHVVPLGISCSLYKKDSKNNQKCSRRLRVCEQGGGDPASIRTVE